MTRCYGDRSMATLSVFHSLVDANRAISGCGWDFCTLAPMHVPIGQYVGLQSMVASLSHHIIVCLSGRPSRLQITRPLHHSATTRLAVFVLHHLRLRLTITVKVVSVDMVHELKPDSLNSSARSLGTPRRSSERGNKAYPLFASNSHDRSPTSRYMLGYRLAQCAFELHELSEGAAHHPDVVEAWGWHAPAAVVGDVVLKNARRSLLSIASP